MPFYDYMTGEEYTGDFPQVIESLQVEYTQDGRDYSVKEILKSDPNYQEELERYMFKEKGCLFSKQKPEWAT